MKLSSGKTKWLCTNVVAHTDSHISLQRSPSGVLWPQGIQHQERVMPASIPHESPLVYPYPENTPNLDHGLSFPSPETWTMVWVSRFPGKYSVWGGLSFGLSFAWTMVWVSSGEVRNTGVGVDEWSIDPNNQRNSSFGPVTKPMRHWGGRLEAGIASTLLKWQCQTTLHTIIQSYKWRSMPSPEGKHASTIYI